MEVCFYLPKEPWPKTSVETKIPNQNKKLRNPKKIILKSQGFSSPALRLLHFARARHTFLSTVILEYKLKFP